MKVMSQAVTLNNMKPISSQLVKYNKTFYYFLHPFIGILHLNGEQIHDK